jgi:energy-coupling factor transport system substrate-specific component
MGKFSVTTLAVIAVMVAVVAVLTFAVVFPIAATGGYIHFGDAGVYFAAFAFGPIIGGIAGGVGCAVADLILGYAYFAPLTLVAHGLQGFLAGYFGYKKGLAGMIVGWAVGSIALILVYFLGEWLIMPVSLAGALAEVPGNIIQVTVGGLIGIPLVLAVRKAYPPIDRLGMGRTWTEE